MSAFPERLQQLALTIEARALDDGGWPHRLDMTGTASTIVATAHVIEILRLIERPLRHPLVQNGLLYLAREAREQARSTARGEYARYPAYALWGLMRYPGAMGDEVLAAGARAALELLNQFRLPNGGWGNHSASKDLCFPVTTVAIHALDRYHALARPRDRAVVEKLRTDARASVAFRCGGRVGARWWPQLKGGAPCPGATALSILSLAAGTEPQRLLAADGVKWLSANPDKWTQDVAFDRASRHRPWRIMSFSVGMRAVLHPAFPRDPRAGSVADVIGHIDDLWDAEHCGWAEEPGEGASTTGSFGVVSAVQALKRAWPFDPAELMSHRRVRRVRQPSRAPVLRTVTVDVRRRRVLVVAPRIGAGITVDFRDASGWRIVLTLAQRHVDHAASMDKTQMSVSLDELATICSCEPGSVRRAISRVNDRFQSVYLLVDQHIEGGASEVRYIIENAVVEFDEVLVPRAEA